ncbi:phosphoribosyltransferase family protein [Polynucleobacter sp. MWH-UH23A]|uniref:phosphoribosyltransferase family protein n=1 Tax=Polynucleobacter sp. MWH-UH23A TaxID=1855613 RepID=UPI003364C3CE
MNSLPVGNRTCLYETHQMVEVIDRMSSKAAALVRNTKRLAVIGVLRRGAPLADMLTERLINDYQMPAPLRFDLLVKRYGDDLTLIHAETHLQSNETLESTDLTDCTLLIVDDVLYTGHSLLRVVDYLMKKTPARILIACLVDRKVNVLPIKAEIVGVDIQIAAGDVVECHVPPYEPTFGIQLLQLKSKNNESL